MAKVTDFYGDINAIHPFREGNGRTTRTLVSQLSYNAGWNLSWQAIGKELIGAATDLHKGIEDRALVLFDRAITELPLTDYYQLTQPTDKRVIVDTAKTDGFVIIYTQADACHYCADIYRQPQKPLVLITHGTTLDDVKEAVHMMTAYLDPNANLKTLCLSQPRHQVTLKKTPSLLPE